MAVISFGITSYKFSYPILEAITYIIRSYSFKFFPHHPYSCSPLFNLILMDFSMILCLMLEFVSLLRQSKCKDSFQKNITDCCSKFTKFPSNTLFLILLAILDFSCAFLNTFIFHISTQLLSLSRLSEFFFVIILNYLVLKQSMHRHHGIAILFIITGIILLSIRGISFDSYIYISIISNFLFSVLEIIETWIMEYRFLSPYEVIGFKGFYGIIIIVIIGNFKCEKWMGLCEYDENNPKNIIYFTQEVSNIFSNWFTIFEVFCFIILTIIYNIFHQLILKHLGPTHRIISDGVFSIINVIISFSSENQEIVVYYIILQIIGHISLIIGIIIYNEIIIVKLCGLDVNTVKEIKDRASTKVDYKMMLLPLFDKTNDKVDIL